MTDAASSEVRHVIHKPTAQTLCGQPRTEIKPAEGEPCSGCATAMYDVFGDLLDELAAERVAARGYRERAQRAEAELDRLREELSHD